MSEGGGGGSTIAIAAVVIVVAIIGVGGFLTMSTPLEIVESAADGEFEVPPPIVTFEPGSANADESGHRLIHIDWALDQGLDLVSFEVRKATLRTEVGVDPVTVVGADPSKAESAPQAVVLIAPPMAEDVAEEQLRVDYQVRYEKGPFGLFGSGSQSRTASFVIAGSRVTLDPEG